MNAGRKLRLGELFAGIGGWSLGLERTGGFETTWSCEIDPFCRRVLAKHWPLVPCFPDIRHLHGRPDGRIEYRDPETGIRYIGEAIDVLCGGFPCQDLSVAGKGAGITGARSGLWFEYLRLIRETRPRWVLVENVPALRTRGLHVVLEGLAESGYDAEWDGIPASAVGAHHQRDRIWLVAYPQRSELRQQPGWGGWSNRESPTLASVDGEVRPVANAQQARLEGHGTVSGESEVAQPGHSGFSVAHPNRNDGRSRGPWGPSPSRTGQPVSDGPLRDGESRAGAEGEAQSDVGRLVDGLPIELAGPRWVEPAIPRTAEGVPDRKARLSALGNANVPQISQWIGQRVLEYEARVA